MNWPRIWLWLCRDKAIESEAGEAKSELDLASSWAESVAQESGAGLLIVEIKFECPTPYFVSCSAPRPPGRLPVFG